MSVSVIIVSFNGRELLGRCLRSVMAEVDLSADEVLVVDNASTDGAPDLVAEWFPEVALIRSASNSGFAVANNRAIVQASGEYVMLLNPDTELSPGVLSALKADMVADSDIGMLGPRLCNTDGSLQYSMRRFPTLGRQLAEAVFLHRILGRLGCDIGEVVRASDAYCSPHDVDWISGAAMFVRREAIVQAGIMDEDYFLYSEETDWCRRIRTAGWRIRYTPRALVLHHGAEAGANPRLFAELVKSKLRYVRTHLGPHAAALFRVVMAVQFVLRWIGWKVVALVSGRRKLDAVARASMYAMGARAAVTPWARQPNWVLEGDTARD
jgi:N-acetylglucosaminyl-diphospho-decaprenol L-rhamnosyltransferase